MRNNRLIIAVILASLYAFPAAGAERTVTSVVIEESGLNIQPGDASLSEGCKSFRPTVAQIKRYFSRAYAIDAGPYMHERYSPCYAIGKVKFSDRTSGEFQLRSSGIASLTWSYGGRSVDLLYKRNKWHDPFACAYGLGDEPEC